jgi:hypothetical protein
MEDIPVPEFYGQKSVGSYKEYQIRDNLSETANDDG